MTDPLDVGSPPSSSHRPQRSSPGPAFDSPGSTSSSRREGRHRRRRRCGFGRAARGLGGWFVVRLLERHSRRPGFWWPPLGSTALPSRPSAPPILADGDERGRADGAALRDGHRRHHRLRHDPAGVLRLLPAHLRAVGAQRSCTMSLVIGIDGDRASRLLKRLARLRVGQLLGLLFLIGPLSDLADSSQSPARVAAILVTLAAFVALYLVLLPPIRSARAQGRAPIGGGLALLAALAALTLALGAPRSFALLFVYVVAVAGIALAARRGGGRDRRRRGSRRRRACDRRLRRLDRRRLHADGPRRRRDDGRPRPQPRGRTRSFARCGRSSPGSPSPRSACASPATCTTCSATRFP